MPSLPPQSTWLATLRLMATQLSLEVISGPGHYKYAVVVPMDRFVFFCSSRLPTHVDIHSRYTRVVSAPRATYSFHWKHFPVSSRVGYAVKSYSKLSRKRYTGGVSSHLPVQGKSVTRNTFNRQRPSAKATLCRENLHRDITTNARVHRFLTYRAGFRRYKARGHRFVVCKAPVETAANVNAINFRTKQDNTPWTIDITIVYCFDKGTVLP